MKLINPNLPTANTPERVTAPGFRVFQGTPKPIAPLATIDFYKGQVGVGSEVASSYLGVPDTAGTCYLFTAPQPIARILSIAADGKYLSASPSMTVGTYWQFDPTTIVAVLDRNAAPAAWEISAIVQVPVSIPEENVYDFELAWSGATAFSVEADGLYFLPPALTQAGSLVQVQVSPLHPLRVGSIALIEIAASFIPTNLFQSLEFEIEAELDFPQVVEYLGWSFTPAAHQMPSLWGFSWQPPFLTLFIPADVIGGMAFLPPDRPTLRGAGLLNQSGGA